MKKLLRQIAAAFKAKPEAQSLPSQAVSAQKPFVTSETHNEIERLLMEAATNPAARQTFLQALLKANLYAATQDVPGAEDRCTLNKCEHLNLLSVRGPDGTFVAAIFTSQIKIVEFFRTGAGFVGMKGEALLEIVAATGAWLNPGSPYNVFWTPADLASVLGKPVPRTLTKSTEVLMGTPADPPLALIDSLRSVLGTDNRIAEAWFALARWAEEGKDTWYLDIRTDLDRAVVQNLLEETLRHADYAGRALDMSVKKPGGEEGIGIRIAPLQAH